MKTVGALIIGFFLVLSVRNNKKTYPQVKEISFEKSKTFEETMQETELYKKTVIVEDTILQTQKILKEIKDEKIHRRPAQISQW